MIPAHLMPATVIETTNLVRLVHVFDVLAAVLFAVSGALVASRKGMDVVGFMWLAVITGVGGGTVIVPLLILWLGFREREATGTSLAAIVVIALLAAIGQGIYGNVDVAEAALVGVPAIAGIIAGTALQQRLPARAISLLFALLLLAIAIELVIP